MCWQLNLPFALGCAEAAKSRAGNGMRGRSVWIQALAATIGAPNLQTVSGNTSLASKWSSTALPEGCPWKALSERSVRGWWKDVMIVFKVLHYGHCDAFLLPVLFSTPRDSSSMWKLLQESLEIRRRKSAVVSSFSCHSEVRIPRLTPTCLCLFQKVLLWQFCISMFSFF